MPSLGLTETNDGDVRVLSLRGELDVETERSLHKPLLAAVEEHEAVIVDATALTFVDSHGMRLLIAALRISTRLGRRLLIACANPTVLRLFAVTGMDRTFEILPTREAALAALAAG